MFNYGLIVLFILSFACLIFKLVDTYKRHKRDRKIGKEKLIILRELHICCDNLIEILEEHMEKY